MEEYGNDSSSAGLQELYTDFDHWICRFNAQLISRSSKSSSDEKSLNVNQLITSSEINSDRTTHSLTQTHPVTTVQEVNISGCIVAQKRESFSNIMDCFNLFKKNGDFTHYDYVLLTLVNENGRKNIYKYIRSKI